MEGEDNIDSFY